MVLDTPQILAAGIASRTGRLTLNEAVMGSENNGQDPGHTTDSTSAKTKPNRVSSPAATGGAGRNFEQYVDTYWLAQLLVAAIPPILTDCVVQKVHLQTEHLGWHTDDVLVTCRNGGGITRKLVGQVKRKFTVSDKNDECHKAFRDFWNDFNHRELFDPSADRLVLIVRRGTNTLLEHFSGLLECARSAEDGADFERRLATPGMVNGKSVTHCEAIQRIVEQLEGRQISQTELWPFLSVLHVLSLDLDSDTRQAEARMKALLAYTTSEVDDVGAADATWSRLHTNAGDGMGRARSYRRKDLPEDIRTRHSPLSSPDHKALGALRDHSSTILGRIRTTIGSSLHLERAGLVQRVIENLETDQVVLLTGTAGSGKSVIAKEVLEILGRNHFIFGFRAEEFATAHFNDTLQRSQIPVNSTALKAILAAQDQKVLLVESVERLLEKDVRKAFGDLLTLVAGDPSWRLVLTCRDYAVDPVRAAFLRAVDLSAEVVPVGGLTDAELDEVASKCPSLRRPLSDGRLRRILRSPYVLDKAFQLDWAKEAQLPQSEREFRQLFWQEVVRADHRTAAGMPQRRERVFQEIAVRRAHALSQFIQLKDIDAEVVNNLRHDSLVIESPQSKSLVAPAHDVLEDWAILKWLDDQHAVAQGSLQDFATSVGTHPSLRRSYRQWVTELVDCDPATADRLFEAVMREPDVPTHLRDDTLVSLLRSDTSVDLLSRHTPKLFADNKHLLKQTIHLLRVACVTVPEHWETLRNRVSIVGVPTGPAWTCVLQLVENHLDRFGFDDRSLLLGLIEDWARGVNWQRPYPNGADSVAAIAHDLLPSFDDYRSEKQRKRILEVIARIPNAAPARFAALLRGDDEEQRRATREFQRLVFDGIAGTAAARDLPDLIVTAGKEYLLCTEADVAHRGSRRGRISKDEAFQMVFGLRHDGFESPRTSAFRGPWLVLLREQPDHGIDFILDVINHSADWYSRPRVTFEYASPPDEVVLTFADGTTRKQWSDERLWQAYRGTAVVPYRLQSLLMALEHWLLEFAEQNPDQLDTKLLQLLQRSDSVAVTAVVASTATAHPSRSSETLLVLLQTPELVRLDRQRCAQDMATPPGSFGRGPIMSVSHKIYEDERRKADHLPHRQNHLLDAAKALRSGPLAPRVQSILERHCVSHQSVETNEKGEPKAPPAPADAHADVVLLTSRMSLMVWGQKVFKGEERESYDQTQWRQFLEAARAIWQPDNETEFELLDGGTSSVTAVCVRDHWQEMTEEQQKWCIDVICSEIERGVGRSHPKTHPALPGASGVLLCSYVLPMLLGQPLNENQRAGCQRAFALALTHPDSGIRAHVVAGIGEYLWQIDRDLTLRCINALATEAGTRFASRKTTTFSPGDKQSELAAVRNLIRERLFEADGIAEDAYQTLDVPTWEGAEASKLILSVLEHAPDEAVAVEGFRRLAETLVVWWDFDHNPDRNSHQVHSSRNLQTERTLSHQLERFLMRARPSDATNIVEPIIEAVERHPDHVHWILQGLILAETDKPNTEQFWALWKLFADAVRRAPWLGRVDRERAPGHQMLSAIFLVSYLDDQRQHWSSLDGFAHRIDELFDTLPPFAIVLENYLRFLYSIGGRSLPDAFVHIAQSLAKGSPRQMLASSTTLFYMESLLQPFVYGEPRRLKERRDLRDAVLQLLDHLVDAGSSSAFQMRDDFVTPSPIS